MTFAPSHGSITILDTIVPDLVIYREAATHHQPVHRWEPHRAGTTPSASATMLALAHELFPHLAHLTLPLKHTVSVIKPAQEGVM